MLTQSFQSLYVKNELILLYSQVFKDFFHKIQALLLQIQGVFKEKIIFKEFLRT